MVKGSFCTLITADQRQNRSDPSCWCCQQVLRLLSPGFELPGRRAGSQRSHLAHSVPGSYIVITNESKEDLEIRWPASQTFRDRSELELHLFETTSLVRQALKFSKVLQIVYLSRFFFPNACVGPSTVTF